MTTGRTDFLDTRLVTAEDEFLSLRRIWNTLLAESPSDTYFLRWEWLSAWWDACRPSQAQLCVLLFSRSHELVGIAPFYVLNQATRRLDKPRTLMFLGTREGHVISEYMDVIYRPADAEAVLRELFRYIVQQDLFDDGRLHKVKTTSRTLPIIASIAREMDLHCLSSPSIRCPYISLPFTFEEFISQCRPSTRYSVRRNYSRLKQYRDVRFRRTEDPAQLQVDFGEFVRLHQLRWQRRNQSGSFAAPEFRRFQNNAMRHMCTQGHLELWFLSVEGKNIAAQYNIRYGDRLYHFQSGLDVAFDRQLSAGTVLHSHCIQEAIKRGVREYDLLLQGSNDCYKDRWTETHHAVCDLYIRRKGLRRTFALMTERGAKYFFRIRGAINRRIQSTNPARPVAP